RMDLAEHRREDTGQDALGFVPATEREHFVRHGPEQVEHVAGMGLLVTDAARIARAALQRFRRQAVANRHRVANHGPKHELVLADLDAIAVFHAERLVDAPRVHVHAVHAAEIAHAHRTVGDDELGVLSRHQIVVDHDVAPRAPADRERTDAELDVLRAVLEPEALLGRALPSGLWTPRFQALLGAAVAVHSGSAYRAPPPRSSARRGRADQPISRSSPSSLPTRNRSAGPR